MLRILALMCILTLPGWVGCVQPHEGPNAQNAAGAGVITELKAKRWIAANGDPREPDADPIDWIEEIPYGETRNYVQRILENLQVYRARIAGGDRPLRIVQDLYGTNPVSEPLHYTPALRQAPQQSKGAQKIKK